MDASIHSATHRHSSQEEITIKMGQPTVNVTHSFNKLASTPSCESLEAKQQDDQVKLVESVKVSQKSPFHGERSHSVQVRPMQ